MPDTMTLNEFEDILRKVAPALLDGEVSISHVCCLPFQSSC